MDDMRFSIKRPIKTIHFCNKSICQEKIIVDELAICASCSLGDTPTEGLAGAGEDLGLAGGILSMNLISARIIM